MRRKLQQALLLLKSYQEQLLASKVCLCLCRLCLCVIPPSGSE